MENNNNKKRCWPSPEENVHSDTCPEALFYAPWRGKAFFLIRMGTQRNMRGGDYRIAFLAPGSFVGGKQ